MIKQIEESFLDFFKELKDPRSGRNRLYTMSEILLTTLAAAICGAEGWQDVEDFGVLKLDYFKQILPYKNGIPSDDTFRRFFRSIDPEAFQGLFRNWVKHLHKELRPDVIAIDGKSSRRSINENGEMLHMISAFATEARLVLAQEKVSAKSNEITAIPKLLEYLDLRGATVTLDAMGCQYKIADQILNKGGDYIFSLKGNQGELSNSVKAYFNDCENQLDGLSFCEDHDKGHGRIETRKCWVISDIAWIRQHHTNWKSIKSIVKVDSTREIKNKKSIETRYYISSLQEKASKVLARIRSHWAIENSLHWVLDMSFGEDQSRIRKHNAPQVMGIVRHIALNLLQGAKNNMKRQSIRRLRKMAGWDNQTLTNIISQQFS